MVQTSCDCMSSGELTVSFLQLFIDFAKLDLRKRAKDLLLSKATTALLARRNPHSASDTGRILAAFPISHRLPHNQELLHLSHFARTSILSSASCSVPVGLF